MLLLLALQNWKIMFDYGNSSIAGHLCIGDNVKIAGHSGIGSDIDSDSVVQSSLFAYDLKKFQRSNVLFKKTSRNCKKDRKY